MDVVVSSQDDSKVAWFKGDGAGNFGTANVVTTSCNACRQVVAFDLNGDGWLDLIAAEGGSKTVSIFINPTADAAGLISDDWNTILGSSPPSSFSFELSKAVSQIRPVFAADVNGDGLMDVLTADAGNNRIRIFIQDGPSQEFFPTFSQVSASVSASARGSLKP